MNYIHPPNKELYYKQVWAVVRQIPYGKVATYGQITKILMKPEGVSSDDYKTSSARWVGLAMAACPDDVPWQRVINSQGKISRRAESEKQKQRLEAEGVLFSNDKINLIEFQWRGATEGAGRGNESEQGRLF